MKQLVLENGSFLPPKVLVLQGFYVEILFSLEDFYQYLTPMLGGDRFFNVFYIDLRHDAVGTARFSLQKALFYKVSMLKCYCGSRTVLSVVLPCWAGIVFSMQFLPLPFRIDFRIDQGFYLKRYRKRNRRGFETGKLEVC